MCTPIPRCPITPLTIESTELSSLFYFLSCFWLLSWSEDQIPKSHMSILSVCRISQRVMQEVHAWVFPALTPDLLWTSTLASHVTSRASISAVMTNTNQVRPWDYRRSRSFFAQVRQQDWLSVTSSSSQLHPAPVSCVIFQEIRWERETSDQRVMG